MMIAAGHTLGWARRPGLAVLLAVIMIIVSFVALQLNVMARAIGSGIGGCGNFIDAVADVENGDTIAVMVPPRDSGGATITKNIIIQGGWSPDTGDCISNGTNIYTDTQALLAAGFKFEAPAVRSTLFHDSEPVVTLDPDVLTLTIQHLILENQGINTAQGGGISGVISNAAYVILENIILTNSTTLSNGGGLYLEVRGGSRLEILDSQFIANQSPNGAGFEIHIFDDSEVVISNTLFAQNQATSGNGGGGRVVINKGRLTVRNSSFMNNHAFNGSGGGLSIEAIGPGPATAMLTDNQFTGNIAGNDPTVHVSGNVFVFSYQISLPVILTN